MSMVEVPLRETAGVALYEVSGSDSDVARAFRLSSRRLAEPRLIANELDAHTAFDLEVIATLADPSLSGAIDESTERPPRPGNPPNTR